MCGCLPTVLAKFVFLKLSVNRIFVKVEATKLLAEDCNVGTCLDNHATRWQISNLQAGIGQPAAVLPKNVKIERFYSGSIYMFHHDLPSVEQRICTGLNSLLNAGSKRFRQPESCITAMVNLLHGDCRHATQLPFGKIKE